MTETPLSVARRRPGAAWIAELDGAGAVVSRFVWGTRNNLPEYMVRGGATYRFVADHLGSPRLVVDTATGQIVQRMSYDAWGNVTRDTNPGFQPFGFAGGLWDADTGLVRFGARDYDPRAGRFTTRDPVGFAGRSTNLYTYAGNDPVAFIDPTGLVRSLCAALDDLCKLEKQHGVEEFYKHIMDLTDFPPMANEWEVRQYSDEANTVPENWRDGGENFPHTDGKVYDLQYVQMGYALGKQVGFAAGAGELFCNGMQFIDDTIDGKGLFDIEHFIETRGEDSENGRGFDLGERAAEFESFCAFAKDFCEECEEE